jgi:hypothetical protein
MAASRKTLWKKGRGKLGILEPLIGTWTAETDSPMGRVRCTRKFASLHGDKWVRLDAVWELGGGKRYVEHAVYGVDTNGSLKFWSFTSDGKRSEGALVEASDIHPEALASRPRCPRAPPEWSTGPSPTAASTGSSNPKRKKAGTASPITSIRGKTAEPR